LAFLTEPTIIPSELDTLGKTMKLVLTASAYILIVFPLAIGWHLGFFREKYVAFGYFEGEPNVLLGLAAIVMQGIALALIYPHFQGNSAGFVRAFQFASLMGLFFWTSHVLAFVAKNTIPNCAEFMIMESAYLIIQFGLFGLAVGLIHRSST